MIRRTGRYRNQKLELDEPLDLADGAEVEIDIHPNRAVQDSEAESWREQGMHRLEEEWDNPQDAVYDNWRQLYDVDRR